MANSKTNFQKSSVNSNEDHSRTKRQNRKIFDDLIDETGEIPFIDDPMFVTPDALGFFQGNGSFLTSIQVLFFSMPSNLFRRHLVSWPLSNAYFEEDFERHSGSYAKRLFERLFTH